MRQKGSAMDEKQTETPTKETEGERFAALKEKTEAFVKKATGKSVDFDVSDPIFGAVYFQHEILRDDLERMIDAKLETIDDLAARTASTTIESAHIAEQALALMGAIDEWAKANEEEMKKSLKDFNRGIDNTLAGFEKRLAETLSEFQKGLDEKLIRDAKAETADQKNGGRLSSAMSRLGIGGRK